MGRLLPIVVFVVTTAVGLGMTFTVFRFVQAAETARFEIVADDVVDRLQERVSQHITLLVATRALFVASGGSVTRTAFRDFVAGLDLDGEFGGIQGIGFARFVPVGDETAIEMEIFSSYDMNVTIWPETGARYRTPIVLLEPLDDRNRQAIGFDMYTNDVRRHAMDRAATSGVPEASGPVQLVQEITSQKQTGFLVYLEFSMPEATEGNEIFGFVYAPFRAGDLHLAALNRQPKSPVLVETRDITDGGDSLLFRSSEFDAGAGPYKVERLLEVAGREWLITIQATAGFGNPASFLSVYLLGAVSLFFAAALAVSARAQLRALEAARELNAVSQKTVEEKELMLQEMKHRIKNSLARVLAIARQTAANSTSLEGFTDSFASRMQSMANAQDMLTRSRWNKADLRQLLESELSQVIDDDGSRCTMEGETVLLDEKSTQALGLTFHELATNAMKYGAMAGQTGQLTIKWFKSGKGRSRRLVIDWNEEFCNKQDRLPDQGFGTRLIDANIEGELGGEITRKFHSNGMSIRIDVPDADVS